MSAALTRATRALLLLLALVVAARPAAAQRVTKEPPARAARSGGTRGGASRRCRLDTASAWYRGQRAWADESRHDWSDEPLRAALLRAAGVDPAAGDALPGFELVGQPGALPAGADAAEQARMLDTLRALARNRQARWPTRSVVGASGVRAVWLLVAADSALSRTALHRMMEAGPDESPPAAVATLEDRLRVAAGRKQIYGTQFVLAPDGTPQLAPLEDPPHVDLRRDGAGLPPLAASICAARAPPRR